VPLRLAIDLDISDDIILAILESYPMEGTKSIALEQEVGKYKRLPLHNAILFDASKASILDMINVYPNAARFKDESNNDGELPIHLALQLGRSEEVIIALLIAYPEFWRGAS